MTKMGLLCGFLGGLMLPAALAGAETIYRDCGTSAIARLTDADGSVLTVEFCLPGLEAEMASLPGFGDGWRLGAPRAGCLAEVGCPHLPVYRCMVRIPPRGGVAVEFVAAESFTWGPCDVVPFQPFPTRGGRRSAEVISREVYAPESGHFPQAVVEVEAISILGGIRVAWLRFHPVRYDPARRNIEVITRAAVRLVPQAGSGANELRRPTLRVTRSFLPSLAGVLGHWGETDAVDGAYVIISTAAGLARAGNLIEWKSRRGYDVRIGRVPDIGASAPEIDAWIENAFHTWENPPEWILIVGDEEIVPAPVYNGFAADNIYGVVGGGTVPTIHVGRLTGEHIADLDYQAWKITEHERDPYQVLPSWFERAISIGSRDDLDPEHSWLYAQIFMNAGMIVDWFCVEGGLDPTIGNISAAINEGRSLISYLGHGSLTRWETSGFNNGSIAALENGRRLPWISTMACDNGRYTGGDYCFAEAWMSEGDIDDPRGGLGVLAATTDSPVGPTDVLAEFTFRGYFEEGIHHMGAAVDYGKLKVYEVYGLNDEDNNMMHMVFGCPEIDIHHVPAPLPQLTVTYDPQITLGSYTVNVSAEGSPLAGALVGLFQYATHLDGARTDAAGNAVLEVERFPAGTAPVEITVTAHNKAPHFGEAQPQLGPQNLTPGTSATPRLAAGRPNPCTVQAVIAYETGAAGPVQLALWDASGRLVRRLMNGMQPAGRRVLQWDLRGEDGRAVTAGVYVCRLKTPRGQARRCLVVLAR